MGKTDIRIVGIGGGTGLSNLLGGIKLYTSNITAIVTVTDDGGSSGRLREYFNMPPPGDIRNCIDSLPSQIHFSLNFFNTGSGQI